MSFYSTQAFEKLVNLSSIDHLKYNYSQSEVGLRHPSAPLGFVCRDQGFVDLYAGPARFILDLTGVVAMYGGYVSISGETVHLDSKDIDNFVINNKVINKDFFTGNKKPISAKNKELFKQGKWITADFQVDPETGLPVRGFHDISTVLEEDLLFEDSSEVTLPSIRSLKTQLLLSYITKGEN